MVCFICLSEYLSDAQGTALMMGTVLLGTGSREKKDPQKTVHENKKRFHRGHEGWGKIRHEDALKNTVKKSMG